MADRDVRVRMTPSHPGDFMRREIVEELGLNVTKAAEILGVRRATLSALLNGRAGMSAEMALRVEKAFGVSMDMLLQMQAWHDASQMRARHRDRRGAVSARLTSAPASHPSARSRTSRSVSGQPRQASVMLWP